MKEPDLNDLISRYEKGLCLPEEIQYLKTLTDENLNDSGFESSFDDRIDIETVHDRIWTKLLLDVDRKSYYLSVLRTSFPSNRLLWAASVVLLIGIAVIPWLLMSRSSQTYRVIAKNDDPNLERKITLPDGSKLILKGSSSVAIHKDFNKSERAVILYGSALFEVAKDKNKPFIISSGELTTKVLGTCFAITNRKGSDEIEVNVYSGKVSVGVSEQLTAGTDLILTPNLKAVYDKNLNTLREALMDNPALLQPEDFSGHAFQYHEEKLTKIINEIETAYGIDIILLNEDAGNHLITGDMQRLTLFQKLNLISSVADLLYEIKGSKIILKDSL